MKENKLIKQGESASSVITQKSVAKRLEGIGEYYFSQKLREIEDDQYCPRLIRQSLI